jgi:hypothetical protein
MYAAAFVASARVQVREGGGEEATGEAMGSRTRRAAHRASGAEDSDDSGGEQVRTVLERGVPLAKRRQCAPSPPPPLSPWGASLLLLLPAAHAAEQVMVAGGGGTARLVAFPPSLPPSPDPRVPARARAPDRRCAAAGRWRR